MSYSKPIPFEVLNSPNKHPFELNNKFIPILANFDSLSFLTTPKSIPTVPELPIYDSKDRPLFGNSYSYVRHYKQSHYTTSAPRTTPHTVTLFSPANSYLNPSAESDHTEKDQWDIKMNVPDELRDLLKSERARLRNITQAIGIENNAHKSWPITSSRAAHRDADVFIGRANNPFGHSTRWKWR